MLHKQNVSTYVHTHTHTHTHTTPVRGTQIQTMSDQRNKSQQSEFQEQDDGLIHNDAGAMSMHCSLFIAGPILFIVLKLSSSTISLFEQWQLCHAMLRLHGWQKISSISGMKPTAMMLCYTEISITLGSLPTYMYISSCLQI